MAFINRFHLIAKSFQYAAIFLASLLLASASDTYVFTDQKGRELEAIIRDYNSEEVTVQRASDGRRFSIDLNTLSEKDQKYLKEKFATEEDAQQQTTLTPGETMILDFPDLGNMAGGKPTQCQISVPKNYDLSRRVPLLVWFSPGAGSHLTKKAHGLVDFDKFLVVALPYPNGRFPRLAVEEGEDAINEYWDYLSPMMEKVIELAPNISEEVRIAGGSSSGGHLVGSALDQRWRGFCNYFTGFVLHEGGTSPEMEFSGTRSSHHILVIYGENSVSKEWQQYFIKRFDEASGRTTYIEVAKAGHGLNADTRKKIHGWVEETFKDELN